MTPFAPFDSKKTSVSIQLCQTNTIVGDIAGNAQNLLAFAQQVNASGNAIDLLVFPELHLTGYQPEDLLLRPAFIKAIRSELDSLAGALYALGNMPVLLGAPTLDEGVCAPNNVKNGFEGGNVFNSAYLLVNDEVIELCRKQCLPNTGVFDEARYFSPADEGAILDLYGHKLGICVCEDLWHPEPVQGLKQGGAHCVIGLNASPYYQEKHLVRMEQMQARVAESGLPLAYLNMVGGQDELVFDGQSFVLNKAGDCVALGAHCAQDVIQFEFDGQDFCSNTPLREYDHSLNAQYKRTYDALVLGTRDYIHKNGFKTVILGLSGGIDSALTLAIAVDALGKDNVRTLMMPSRYTSDMSLTDAQEMANRLGVRHDTVAIEDPFKAFLSELNPLFEGAAVDTTEENIQARIRGVMLMAMSNKTGAMVLTTGNKSEYAVGYATLYGDMCGGFAPIKDVYKTLVFELCRWRNLEQAIIPTRIIERPPSAELAPDQKDEDSLPPYDVLDAILQKYIEQRQSVEQIIAQGFNEHDVKDSIRRLNFNEYKRRQSAPGVKVTKTAFGRDRRYPITNKFDRRF